MPLHPAARRVLLHLRQFSQAMQNIHQFCDSIRGLMWDVRLQDEMDDLRQHLLEWRRMGCLITEGEVRRVPAGVMGRPDSSYPEFIQRHAEECEVAVPALQLLSSLERFCQRWQRNYGEPCSEIESYVPPISTWRVMRYSTYIFENEGETYQAGMPEPVGEIPPRREATATVGAHRESPSTPPTTLEGDVMWEPGKVEFYESETGAMEVKCPGCGAHNPMNQGSPANPRIVAGGSYVAIQCYECERQWFTWLEDDTHPLHKKVMFSLGKKIIMGELCALLNTSEWQEIEWGTTPTKSRLELLRES